MPVENAMPLSIADSFGVSILGFAIVFFVLVVLMFVIKILRGIVEQMNTPAASAAVPAAAASVAAVPAPAANMVPAKGSLGEIKLYDVEDKTAAMIMAIVANELNAPLNELRFRSIREKK